MINNSASKAENMTIDESNKSNKDRERIKSDHFVKKQGNILKLIF